MPIPEVLYKYTTADTAKIILNNESLRWSSPQIFNDLGEFQIIPRFSPPIEEAWGTFKEMLIEHIYEGQSFDTCNVTAEVLLQIEILKLLKSVGDSKSEVNSLLGESAFTQEHITESLRGFIKPLIPYARVICFSTTDVNKLMLAHYAGSNSGCVLGFRDIPELNSPWGEARKVNYVVNTPSVMSGLDFLLYGENPSLRKITLDTICFTKKKDWEYEDEWRVLVLRKNDERLYSDIKFLKDELCSITLCPQLEEQASNEIKNLVREHYAHCKIYELSVANGEIQKNLIAV